MKNVWMLVFVALIAAILILSLVTFQVRETEKVLVLTFDKATRSITDPGFYWKLPTPIQTVRRLPSIFAVMRVFQNPRFLKNVRLMAPYPGRCPTPILVC